MVTENRIVAAARRIGAFALLCALGFAPLGAAFAQEPDFEAVGARLVEAVKAGELTREQAAAMMGELARARFAQRLAHALGEPGRAAAPKTLGRHFLDLGVSEETLAWTRKALAGSGIGGARADQVLGLMLRLLTASREKPVELDQAMLDRFMGDFGLSRAQIGAVLELTRRLSKGLHLRDRIQAAVKAGDLSAEEGTKKLLAARKELFGDRTHEQPDPRPAPRGDLEKAAQEIHKAVAEGKLSPEEGRAKMERLRKALAERAAGKGTERPQREETERVKEAIRAAVKEGKITEAQARERWEGYLKKVRSQGADRGRGKEERKERPASDRRAPTREEMAKVKERIWAAVKSGRITEEQAEKAWEAYLENLRQSKPKRDRR